MLSTILLELFFSELRSLKNKATASVKKTNVWENTH